jgi:DNA-binding beta-propeller fold protein YncE
MARRLVLIAGVVLLATSAAAAHVAHRDDGGWFDRHADHRRPWLYVSSDRNSVVTAYDLGIVGAPLARKITQGIDSPGGIALDAIGNLYVANERGNDVTVYAPDSNTPSLTIGGINDPESPIVDAAGNLWVCNRGGQAGIYEFSPGQTTPSQHITGSLIRVPTQMAFDASGTLYVGDNDSGIYYLTRGSQTVTQLNLQGYQQAESGLAIDPADGGFYLSNALEGPYYVTRYAAGATEPEARLGLNFGGLDFLAVGAIRGHEHLFVPDSQGNFIYVLEPSLKGTPGVITTASGYVAVGVAFKPAGVP